MAFENFKMEESFNRFQRKWLIAGMVSRALASDRCGMHSISGRGVPCGLSSVLILVIAPRVFSRSSSFHPSTKTNISNSNSTRKQWTRIATAWMFTAKFREFP